MECSRRPAARRGSLVNRAGRLKAAVNANARLHGRPTLEIKDHIVAGLANGAAGRSHEPVHGVEEAHDCWSGASGYACLGCGREQHRLDINDFNLIFQLLAPASRLMNSRLAFWGDRQLTAVRQSPTVTTIKSKFASIEEWLNAKRRRQRISLPGGSSKWAMLPPSSRSRMRTLEPSGATASGDVGKVFVSNAVTREVLRGWR